MTDYGVTATGFVKKTLAIILGEIEDSEKEEISPTLNLLGTAVMGQLNGIVADKIRELWDVTEAVYRAAYPDSASDSSLEDVASITGALREEAEESTVTLDWLFLDAGTTVPIGSVVSIGADGARFVLTTVAENLGAVAATVSAEAESEDTGIIVGNANTINTIQTPISGWDAKAAITNDTAEIYSLDGLDLDLIVDASGTVQTVSFSGGNPWSAADVATEIVNETTGIEAIAVGAYVRISSATDGTGSAIQVDGGSANTPLDFQTDEIKGFNANDATPGQVIESDVDFRIRREQLLRATGKGTVEAIRAELLELTDVDELVVFQNVTDVTDGDGLPPHSVEIVYWPYISDPQDFAEAIWNVVGAGIATYGTSYTTITDSMGFTHDMYYTLATAVPLHMEVDVDVDATYTADGDDQVETILAALAAEQGIGDEVIALRFKSEPFDVGGVVDVTAFTIDTVDPPVGTVNIPIGIREIATGDTSDIDVTSTPV